MKITRDPTTPPLLLKLETMYGLWHTYIIHVPKIHRYSLAAKIDSLLCELIQYTASALFLKGAAKLPYLQKAIQVLDTAKVLLRVAVSVDAITVKQYETLALKLHEIGKMLGGWHNQVLSKKEQT